jgi:succinate dehydrogenase/fumarate reductase flavoprotein subunit
MTYDVIIIGAGSAGMPCAIQAAARGLQVLVIEKDEKIGGTLHLTAGHLSAAGTKRQVEKGIEDTVVQHFNDVKRISRNTVDELIAHKAITLAPKTIDWLQELGYIFHEATPMLIHGHEPYGVPRTYFGKDDYAAKDIVGSGKTVLKTILPLWNQYFAQGFITVWLNHQMTALKKNDNKIEAVIVTDVTTKITKEIAVTHADVVVTTGGYAANGSFYNEVIQPFKNDTTKHFPNRLISTANEHSQGDGIKAIMSIDGHFYGAEKHMSTLGGIELEPKSGRASFWEAWARVSNSNDRIPREIYINENGDRFMNEHDLTVDERERIVLQQPNQRFYVVFDEKALQEGPCIVVQWDAARFKEESIKEKCCWQANSIEALAHKINIPVERLVSTVQQFNVGVTNKLDEQFGRSVLNNDITQPPYYALLVYAYSLISFGGIKVNENLNVLCNDGTTISNLYAAGEVLGAGATSGNSFCGGMLLTPALSFGKWLGETLQQK